MVIKEVYAKTVIINGYIVPKEKKQGGQKE